MQSLDVQAKQSPDATGKASLADLILSGGKIGRKSLPGNGKTGAETARNGSSFPAMIERIIAGSREGADGARSVSLAETTGRGAGNKKVPGATDTLIKTEKKKPAGKSPNGMDGEAGDSFLAASAQLALNARNPEQHDVSKNTRISMESAGMGESSESGESGITGASPAGKNLRKGNGALAGNTSQQTDAGAFNAIARSVRTGEAESTRNAEQAKTDRKDRKAVIGVRDERFSRHSAEADGQNVERVSAVSTVKDNGDGTVDMNLAIRNIGERPSFSGREENRLSAGGDDIRGQSFANMLSSELRSNAADFVKTGQIVLRENNSGLIRLTLNPESLGNVRISLELSGDRKISGKIVVASEEAYEAFKENLEGLSEAFCDGGFESAGFDLSWSGAEAGGYGSENPSGAISSPFYASSIPDVMSDTKSADSKTDGYRYSGESAINVFA